jgi:hypothetical protein
MRLLPHLEPPTDMFDILILALLLAAFAAAAVFVRACDALTRRDTQTLDRHT